MIVRLYGAPLSLYTGRARSYLIKAGIDYRETPPISDHYEDVVLAKAGGRRSMPTVELADGRVIRDSVAIVDHFEAERGGPFTPETPRQQATSLLFDVIGAEGMLRPAMHYRWRYPEHEVLLRHQFGAITPRNPPRDLTVEGRFERLKQAPADLGVPTELVDLVESLHVRLLEKLDVHFANVPYLLGGKPSVGDFGLIAPMYAHLGRDLKPLSLMHAHAPNVLRWVERMNRPEPDIGGFEHLGEDFLGDDDVPETLIDVLRHFAIDFVPETLAVCDATNTWLRTQPALAPGTTVERSIGTATFEVEGRSMTAVAQPFRLYLLKRLQDHVAALMPDDRAGVTRLLEHAGMSVLLEPKLDRDIGRANNLEVWI
jgi:glutathione S-transferase